MVLFEASDLMEIRSETKMINFEQQIPEDVMFNHIFCHLLDDAITRIRLAAVCRSWRAYIRNAPHLMPFVFGVDCDGKGGTSTGLVPYIFNPITTTTHRLPQPRETILGTNNAGFHRSYMLPHPTKSCWLPTLLYNPFSGNTGLQLPTTCRYPDGTIKTMNYIPPYINTQQSSLDPSNTHPRLVAVVQHADNRVFFYNTPTCDEVYDGQDQDYSWVVSSPIYGDKAMIEDLIFYKDELYCISSDGGRVFALDLHRHLRPDGLFSSCPTPRIVCTHGGYFNPCVNYYLVELRGELMVVVKYYHRLDWREEPKVEFKVHRVNLEKGKLEVVEDLGDAMLFLGKGCSMWRPCSSSREDQFFRKNYIYFFHLSKRSTPFRIGRSLVGSKILEFHPGSLPNTGYFILWVTVPI